MAKPRSWVLDYLLYLAVRLTVCALQVLGYEASRRLAIMLAGLAYRLDRRHHERAMENLRHAYPDLSEHQRDRMVRRIFEHFCTVLIEVVHLPRRLHLQNWKAFVEVSDSPRLLDLLLNRRPLLVVTGHYGNWEMAGYALSMLGFRSHAVARPLDNPYLDRYLRRFREHTGQKLLAKKGELERIEELLRSGEIVCTLADQDAGARGQFVNFFDRPASTHKAIALLALEYRVTLLVVGARKVGEPMRYRIEVADVIDPAEYASHVDAVRAITQRFTSALERLVRIDPRQYLWLHRRWKHQPKRSAKAAA